MFKELESNTSFQIARASLVLSKINNKKTKQKKTHLATSTRQFRTSKMKEKGQRKSRERKRLEILQRKFDLLKKKIELASDFSSETLDTTISSKL